MSNAQTKLNARIVSWSKRGAKFAEDGLSIMQAAVELAATNGNVDPMKRIVGALDKSDAADALVIFSAFFPIVVKDGEISVVKGWAKKIVALPNMGAEIQRGGFVSFRKFAAALRPAKDGSAPGPMDDAAFIAALAKLVAKGAKEGNKVSPDLLKRMGDLTAALAAALEGTPAAKSDNVVDLPTAEAA